MKWLKEPCVSITYEKQIVDLYFHNAGFIEIQVM